MFDRDSNQILSANFNTLLPGYLLRYSGFALSLTMIVLGYLLRKQILIASGFVILAGTLLLFWAARWATQRRYDVEQLAVVETLFGMSQAQPGDNLAFIDLGLRASAIALSRHLTTGQLVVIDVFNPQLTESKELTSARRQAPPVIVDPRLDWFDSDLNLLPLPDNSVSAVFLPQVLSEFGQHGDRLSLLREVRRILQPNGRLLLAEQNTSWLNWLSINPGSAKLQPVDYWRNLLSESGLDLLRQQELHGLSVCIRADKPSPFAGRQLSFNLNYNEVRHQPTRFLPE